MLNNKSMRLLLTNLAKFLWPYTGLELHPRLHRYINAKLCTENFEKIELQDKKIDNWHHMNGQCLYMGKIDNMQNQRIIHLFYLDRNRKEFKA